jgi:hypothetical protein
MSRQTSSENAEVDAEADPAVQKRAASPAADAVRRPKRGKYTAVAWYVFTSRRLSYDGSPQLAVTSARGAS